MPLSDPKQRRALRKELDRLWLLGRSLVVGWRLIDGRIALLLLPNARLSEIMRFHLGLAGSESRYLDAPLFDAAARRYGLDVVLLDSPRFEGAGAHLVAAIDETMRRYSLWFTRWRSVALVDIVGFSRANSLDQAVLLNSLAYSIAIAQRRTRRTGLAVALSRSTTGDGFYLWNDRRGDDADLDLLGLVMAALADNRLAGESGLTAPRLRAAVAAGSHFSYYLPQSDGEAEHTFIVGEATISAARLVAAAAPSQVLVGEALVSHFGSPARFIDRLNGRLSRLSGIDLLSGRLEAIGARFSSGERARPRIVQDKHGQTHRAYNLRADLRRDDGDELSLGLRLVDPPAAERRAAAVEPERRAVDQSETVSPPST